MSHILGKGVRGEPFGMVENGAFLHRVLAERADGLDDGVRSRRVEELSGDAVDDGVQISARVQSQAGGSERETLDGGQTEILLARRNDSSRVGVGPPQLGVTDALEEGYVGRGEIVQFIAQWP